VAVGIAFELLGLDVELDDLDRRNALDQRRHVSHGTDLVLDVEKRTVALHCIALPVGQCRLIESGDARSLDRSIDRTSVAP